MRIGFGLCVASFVFAASLAAAQDTSAPPPPPAPPATPAPETPAPVAPAAPAEAAPAAAAALPPGWVDHRGAYLHDESGLECPATVGQFTRERIDGPPTDQPNILGTCAYYDSKRRYAGMRVRSYAQGVGESELAMSNDDILMSPSSRYSTTVYRVTPMTMPDGTAVQRLMISIKRRGYLIDCFAIMDSDDPTVAMPMVLKLCKS